MLIDFFLNILLTSRKTTENCNGEKFENGFLFFQARFFLNERKRFFYDEKQIQRPRGPFQPTTNAKLTMTDFKSQLASELEKN